MTSRRADRRNPALKSVVVHNLLNELPPRHIAEYMKLEVAQMGEFFWHWHALSETIDFYTTDHHPEASRYQNLAKTLLDLVQPLWEHPVDEYSGFTSRELEIAGSEGATEWANVSILLFSGSDGKPEQAVGTIQNITRWKNVQLALENKLDFINTLLDALVSPIFYKDANLVYRHCNKAFEEYLGKSRDEIINKTVYELSEPHLADIYHNADQDLINGRKQQIYETKVRAADGKERDVIFNKSPVYNRAGQITGMIGIINDITERVSMENRLRRIMGIKDAIMEISRAVMDISTVEEFYCIVLDRIVSAMQSADAGSIMIFDPAGKLKMVAASGLFASEKNPVIVDLHGSLSWNAMEGKTETCFNIENISEFSLKKGFELHEMLIRNGIQSMLGAPILNSGKLIGFITVGSKNKGAYDDTDLFVMEYIRVQIIQAINKQALYEKNVYLARHDGLTGLYNRSHFEALFDSSQKRAHRYTECFHLIVIDLDHFKSINDKYGHHTGDAVLVDFARRMLRTVRNSDIVARYGGDEFILLMYNTTAKGLIEKMEALRKQLLKSPVHAQKIELTYDFSYGISEYPQDGIELDHLTQLADSSMYTYKNSKK